MRQGCAPAVVGLAVVLAGCQVPPGDLEPDAGGAPNAHVAPDAPFTTSHTIPIHIDLSPASMEALRRRPREWTHATASVGLTWFANVGVRLKGATSYQPLTGKAAFKIKFDQYVPNLRLSTLRSITLNNMIQDRSMVHEWLAYRVLRAAQIPAPRSTHARVYVNDVYYGLYAMVESEDDAFLERAFAEAEGDLY